MSVPDGFVDDPTFMPVLDGLVDCLERELDAAGAGDLCYLGHAVGDLMPLSLLANECKGVAWVRPMEDFASIDFPEPSERDDKPLLTPRAMTIEMGVARHYPLPEGRNAYVTPAVMRDTARIIMSDRRAMQRAVRCCFVDFTGSLSIGSWAPVPAEGTLTGGVLTITVRPGV